MCDRIIAQFPYPDYDIYVEPFSGTYTVGLHMPYLPGIEVFNDLERNVYTLYSVLKDAGKFGEFQRRVALTPYHEGVREDAKRALREAAEGKRELTDVDRAYWYFVMNRMSHNGIGGFSVNVVRRRGMSKSVSDYLSCVDRLWEFHERLQRVVMYNRDGLDLMEKYSERNCFLYCDPPYVWSTRGSTRYVVDNDAEWHGRFVEKCIKSRARILISGYDCAEYAALEEHGFRKVKFDVKTVDGARRAKVKTECLWRNYDLGTMEGTLFSGESVGENQ